jgi:glycosyltransferase involved in cell wall biosynthesis
VLARHGLATSPYILALGTIEPRKNHLRLVQAFEQLVAGRRVGDDVVLVIAGKRGWGYTSVMEAIERSPARDRIRVLGYVSDDDLPALLTGAVVVAYVSLYEGFGLPVLEAMTCGAPVLTSNVSSMPEVAGDAAVLVDPRDVPEISRGLTVLINEDEEGRAQHRTAGFARASLFSWERAAREMQTVYGLLG